MPHTVYYTCTLCDVRCCDMPWYPSHDTIPRLQRVHAYEIVQDVTPFVTWGFCDYDFTNYTFKHTLNSKQRIESHPLAKYSLNHQGSLCIYIYIYLYIWLFVEEHTNLQLVKSYNPSYSPQLIFIHIHQIFRTHYTRFDLDAVNIDWWICLNFCILPIL